ncbi:MAG: SGNH/GDSL hydrolase family protein [Oscillibacter sp.]|nr:SGNH/GDSL hydrolase family protein [Oscillibacter sp.]
MKTLFWKCALLCLTAAAVLFAGSLAYWRTETFQELERVEDTVRFRDMPEEIDIAVVGTSHGEDAFQYPPEGCSFFNFSLAAQTPQYDAAMLRQFGDRIPEGGLVVLTLSYMSPYWTCTEEAFESRQPRYYRILSPENMVDGSLSRWVLTRAFPLLTLDPPEIVEALFGPPPEHSVTREEVGLRQLPQDTIPSEQERILRDHWTLIEPSYPEVNPVMWEAYHEMLDLCARRGWQAVLATPPYPAEYSACFPEGFYEEFRAKAEELAEEYGVPYLDYSHHPDYAASHQLFKNLDHLNFQGAERFDRQFFADVEALGLLPPAAES